MNKIKFSNKLLFIIFALALLLFVIFSTKVGFTDTGEYIGLAKEFAGIHDSNLYIYHSVFYSTFLSVFLKIFPSLITLKLINSLWLILTSIILYKLTKNKKILLLWIFSPLVYYMSIFISPILASSFFLILSYYLLKKYEETNKIPYFILSAISLGVITVLRTAEIFIAALFILIFFYNSSFKKAFYYTFIVIIVFLSQLLLDYLVFGFPLYTIINYLSGQTLLYFPPRWLTLSWILSLFIIAPLTFMIYKTKQKKELLFIVIAYLYFSMLAHYRLLLVIAPFVILLLSNLLTKKQILINSIISIVIIVFLTHSYFGENDDSIILNDLKSIESDFNNKHIVTTNGNAYFFPTLYWNDFNYIWLRDYTLKKENKTIYQEYVIEENPKISDSKKVYYIARLQQVKDVNLDLVDEKDLLFVFKKEEIKYDENTKLLIVSWFDERIKIEDVNLMKCYEKLCVFRKK